MERKKLGREAGFLSTVHLIFCHCFGQNTLFYLNEAVPFWLLGF